MTNLAYQPVQCPYCGEWIELPVDPAATGQRCVEDCPVCCRPIEVRQHAGVEGDYLEVSRDDA